MFGFIGKLFGSDKAATALIDNASAGLDKLFYTDEEKAEGALEAKKQAGDLLINWLQATTGSALARRLIALTVTTIWALNYTLVMVMEASVPFMSNIEVIKAVQESSLSLQSNGVTINGAMTLILAFYFAANHIGKVVDVAINKFTQTPKKQSKE